MSATVDAVQALYGLLVRAEESGLPMPFDSAVNNYGPHGHEREYDRIGGISLMFGSLADLAEWSTWLDAPIDDHKMSAENRHHQVFGYAGPIPLRAAALTPLADEAVTA